MARFNFDYVEIPKTIPAFVPRQVEEDELEFDPKTLQPKPRKAQAATEKPSSKAKAKKPAAAKDASGEAATKAPKRTRKQGGARAAKGQGDSRSSRKRWNHRTSTRICRRFLTSNGHGNHGYAPDGY